MRELSNSHLIIAGIGIFFIGLGVGLSWAILIIRKNVQPSKRTKLQKVGEVYYG